MARGMRGQSETIADSGVAVPVDELRGRAVWTEAGDRVGTLRGFRTDDDGRIVALDVRHGWMFGHHMDVDAASMRMEGGDIVVPSGALLDRERTPAPPSSDAHVAPAPMAASSPTPVVRPDTEPVLLAGREGARSRYGGLDMAAGLIGALVAVAAFVLLGGLLAAIFETEVLALDSGSSSWDILTSDALLVGAAALAVSFLLGGWAAGRVARFNGAVNGMSVVLWTIVLGVAFAAMGALFGSEYDLFSSANLPQLDWNDVGTAGVVGLLAGLAIMLVCGALGGMVGSLRNHRVDRRMLDTVGVGTVSGIGYADDSVRSERQAMSDDVQRHETGVMGTPAGSPVAPRPLSTRDSADDVTRPR